MLGWPLPLLFSARRLVLARSSSSTGRFRSSSSRKSEGHKLGAAAFGDRDDAGAPRKRTNRERSSVPTDDAHGRRAGKSSVREITLQQVETALLSGSGEVLREQSDTQSSVSKRTARNKARRDAKRSLTNAAPPVWGYLPLQPASAEEQQRFAFLGKNVASLTIAQHLAKTYPNMPCRALQFAIEEFTSPQRLRMKSQKLGLKDLHASCTAFEAVIGKMYCTEGLPKARLFVENFLLCDTVDMAAFLLVPDSKVQELLAHFYKSAGVGAPEYRMRTLGPPEQPMRFRCIVSLNGGPVGEGRGSTARGAEIAAAQQAIFRLYLSRTPLALRTPKRDRAARAVGYPEEPQTQTESHS